MKRLLRCSVLLAAIIAYAGAQEPEKSSGSAATEEKSPMLGWMWANFAILAIGLGYLVSKNVPPLLRARTEEIQSAMREAARLKAESDTRLAEIERRLSGIAAEVDRLRVELITEMNAEGTRLRAETERLVTRVHDQAEQEIRFMTKTSRLELKAYSAQLAIDLATQRIRAGMNPTIQQQLVDAFISDLRTDGSRGITAQ